jgi:hypothetical protein
VAIDLTGISNVNEFYSHHYLDALLENDIKALIARWEDVEEEGGISGAHKKLGGCAQEFFKGKTEVAQTAAPWDRFDETHRINVLLTEALGYPLESGAYQFLEDDLVLPVLVSLERDGHPYLWIIEGTFPDADNPTLEQTLDPFRLPEGAEEYKLPEDKWEALPALVFRQEVPPRWLLLMAGSEIYLIERHKWGQGKYLLFDIDEILGRRQTDTLKATAALLARDALCPDDGTVLHDALDESSHKHAFAVSEDLKYGIRRAVELLGNEYIWYQREVAHQAFLQDEDLDSKLTSECLTYLYRLLFLFYAEARGGEIEVVPMKSDEYRLGYSLESLRDLEQVPLSNPEAQGGYFIDGSLRKLFRMVEEGFGEDAQYELGLQQGGGSIGLVFDDEGNEAEEGEGQEFVLDHGFTIRGLDSPLFDLNRTPLLSSVRFRNVVLQEVIQLLSLSREGRRERGRISYAQLGINQLGAVYEGLLSYSGFFAQERLYEVKPAGTKENDETQQSYFVPESEIGKYEEEEFVYEQDGEEKGARRRKRYERGSFIFRLAGRDREKSASYYTPEVLTQCVVKYSLKELLKGKSADEILGLTVCEPAMGSGAFLNEAVNQLADAYLERKQQELGENIAPSDYPRERQKVKAFLATHNCYGVDLNPTAVELAKVSLWLNTIYEGSRCPWFDLRLAVGNSLIGARRQVFKREDIQRKKSKKKPNWLELVPERVVMGPEWEERPKDTVYHFLLPDEGMAGFDKDKVIRELAREDIERIKKWRKDFCQPFDRAEGHKLVELSDGVDALWQQVIKERQRSAEQTEQAIGVWGQLGEGSREQTIADQEALAEELERPYTAYRRLKLVMDYWCALWFWPVQEARKLPSRDTFLMDLELILKGMVTAKVDESLQLGLFGEEQVSEEHKDFIRHHGLVNVDELCEKVERLKIAQQVAQQVRFHHWELRFAEVFVERGGFDLIIGNPPWIKVEWNEGGVLGDIDPVLVLRKLSASEIAQRRTKILESIPHSSDYLNEFVEQTGFKNYLKNQGNFSHLKGVQTNLYKCFITNGWIIGSDIGLVGFIHPEGIYEDSKGGLLRKEVYLRLEFHFQFRNEFKLFDIQHTRGFSINIYRTRSLSKVDFQNISSLFHPSTIDNSFSHDGNGMIPTIKDKDGKWDYRPHKKRIVKITNNELSLFSQVLDSPGTSLFFARLPSIQSQDVITVLKKWSSTPQKLGDKKKAYFPTEMWHETNAQKDGTIKAKTSNPTNPKNLILSGPHIFVGLPFYKTPKEEYRKSSDYNLIDLQRAKSFFLPRSNYYPSCDEKEYMERSPKWEKGFIINNYRLAFRSMTDSLTERTLIGAIIPPQVGHINGITSFGFESQNLMLFMAGLSFSIVYDFFVKIIGKANLHEIPRFFPIPEPRYKNWIIERVLLLTCLTEHFCDLWNQNWGEKMREGSLTKEDIRLYGPFSEKLDWCEDCSFRSDFSRRQALLELDTLTALSLNLSMDELVNIFRTQFPVLQQYDRENRYDQTGRLVPRAVLKITDRFSIDTNAPFNVSNFKGDTSLVGEIETPGLGITGGICWEDPKMEPRMERIYPPPFTRCDREEDMRQAYRVFQERIREKEKAVV